MNLNIDLFAKEITYLPFEAVVNLCQTDKRAHEYCINPRYNVWKSLTDNAFSWLTDYKEKLEPLYKKYGEYNYLVYTNFIKTLDKVSQAMIYYRQGDIDKYDNIPSYAKFLAMFLFGKKDEMEKLLPKVLGFKYFIDFLDGKEININLMMSPMIASNCITGVRYLISQGADINYISYDTAIDTAVIYKHLDMINFLIKNGAIVTPVTLNKAEGKIREYLESLQN